MFDNSLRYHDCSIKDIWNQLMDEESKKIFVNRYMFFLTGDFSFLKDTALTVNETKKVYDQLKESPKKKLIFGAGIWGEGILRTFHDIEFECFIDNHREEKELYEFAGKEVISFQDYLKHYRDEIVVISSRVYNGQIYDQLIHHGIHQENIMNIGAINDALNKQQYFDLPQLKEHIQKDECFVDGGSLDGRSSICFQNWCENKYRKIYAIEPDVHNVTLCEENFALHGIEPYEIITKGLWSHEATLAFDESQNGVSKISDQGTSEISVDALDALVNENITFIKMDIEGSEYQALLGCKRMIEEQKPKLAICIYHKPEDVIKIPSLILSYRSDYKFYIRHYSTIWGESVLYAI